MHLSDNCKVDALLARSCCYELTVTLERSALAWGMRCAGKKTPMSTLDNRRA